MKCRIFWVGETKIGPCFGVEIKNKLGIYVSKFFKYDPDVFHPEIGMELDEKDLK